MPRGHVVEERYCGNYITRRVHDLQNEQKDCLIDDFDIPFVSLEIAEKSGYRPCEHCLSDK